MAGPTTVLRRADVLWRTVLDGVLIRRRGDDETILLTGSGLALWLALSEPACLADLADRLARDHQVDPATVLSDIEPAVDDLVNRGVLLDR